MDHKPNRQDERTRIENAGGVVVWAGTWRVGGVLAVSRAFGDRLLKRYVVATPDITETTVGPEDQLVVLASDGLWDVVSNDDAVGLIKDIKVGTLTARIMPGVYSTAITPEASLPLAHESTPAYFKVVCHPPWPETGKLEYSFALECWGGL